MRNYGKRSQLPHACLFAPINGSSLYVYMLHTYRSCLRVQQADRARCSAMPFVRRVHAERMLHNQSHGSREKLILLLLCAAPRDLPGSRTGWQDTCVVNLRPHSQKYLPDHLTSSQPKMPDYAPYPASNAALFTSMVFGGTVCSITLYHCSFEKSICLAAIPSTTRLDTLELPSFFASSVASIA